MSNFSTPFYHGAVQNTIVAFGSLFSDLKIQRKNNAGVVEQTIAVPLAYSQKEKWLVSNDTNPDSERGIYITLPRMGFEITGYSYDSSRKLARMNQIYCVTGDTRNQVFTPVPYNIDIALFFATKTQGDALQILEQILPTFTPEYTLSVNTIPALGLKQDIPFLLNGVSVEDNYEGDMGERRFVVHTLNFTAKVNLYGGNGNVGLIKTVDANVATSDIATPEQTFTATQATPVAPITQAWMNNF